MFEARAEWSELREAGSTRQLRFMRFLGLHAPEVITAPLLWLIALVFVAGTSRPSTKASKEFLRRALGRTPTFWERHRHALVFGRVFFERVTLLADGTDNVQISMIGSDVVTQQVNAGRGAILLGAHLGSFEALRAIDRQLPGLSVRYLMFPEHAENSTKLLGALNPEVADRVISLADGPMAMIQVHEALQNGDFVAFLGDRVPNEETKSKVRVPFLDGEIQIPTSPYEVSMALGVPIILSFAIWQSPGCYRAEFSRLYDGDKISRGERRDKVQELAENYASVLEDHCRRNPFNWFNFFDIWR